MTKFSGIVLYNGNHYDSGEEVYGSKLEIRDDGTVWLYDDFENYVAGLGDFTRYQWVEINPNTIEVCDVWSVR